MIISMAVDKKTLTKEIPSRTIMNMIKDKEYDPAEATLNIDWPDEVVQKIAFDQLGLIISDIKHAKPNSSDYKTAVEFIETPRFESLCEVLGLDVDDAYNRCKFLVMRYSTEYKKCIESILNRKKVTVKTVDITSREFAIELAYAAFDDRSKFTRIIDNEWYCILLDEDYYSYLNKLEVRALTFSSTLNACFDSLHRKVKFS